MNFYCGSASKPWSNEFNAYIENRGYSLLPFDEYVSLFRESGFTNVQGEDKTDLFLKYSEQEKEHFEKMQTKEEFLKVILYLMEHIIIYNFILLKKQEFDVEQYNYLLNSWNEKIARTRAGHQRYGTFSAQK